MRRHAGTHTRHRSRRQGADLSRWKPACRTQTIEGLPRPPRNSGVEIRTKHKRAPMHLKSYQIDGRVLRTGAANFSGSGLKREDNDLKALKLLRPSSTILMRDLPLASYCRSHSLTPPWREHVPVWCCEYEYSPSRHIAVAALLSLEIIGTLPASISRSIEVRSPL
jgi:hypothetical protein